ncbi:hypothetical protein MBLNU230_g0954t1 [Neophaeotheca triangularis]
MDIFGALRILPRAAARARISTHNAPKRLPYGRPTTRSLHEHRLTPSTTVRHRVTSASGSRAINQIRRESSAGPPRPLTDRPDNAAKNESAEARKAEEPSYELTFTCKKCTERSSHRMTKQAYHSGTVLITCPGCKNRHLIADHLKVFSDTSVTIEDIMKEKGQYLKKGRIGGDGDIEFYDDTQKPT